MKKLMKALAIASLAAMMTAGAAFGAVTAKAATVSQAIPSATGNTVTVSESTMYNDYIKIVMNNSTGRFVLGTTGGNPDSESDNDQTMLFGFPNIGSGTSRSTIVVDGKAAYYGSKTYDEAPHFVEEDKANVSSQYFDKIHVTQRLSFVRNVSTGRDDVLEIRYTVTNTDTAAHKIGVRIMLDTMLGTVDSAPFRVAGIGDVTTEREFVGENIPQYWQAFDSLTNPTVVSQGSFFRDGDNTNNPSRVQFCSWYDISDVLWNYEVTDGKNNGDSAVAVTWDEKALAAGQSRTYTTYYGLSELTQNVAPPLSLSVYGDTVVTAQKNDPQTGLPIYKNIAVTAYVENVGNGTATNAFAKLILPTGFSLVSGTARQNFASLEPGEIKQVTWNVKVAGSVTPDLYAYQVCCGCTETETKQVERTVNVPAVLKNNSKVTPEHLTVNEKVKVTAAAEGGYGSYLYAILYKKSDASSWTKLQDYAANTTASFTPKSVGTYQVLVKVKDGNGSISDKQMEVHVYSALVNQSTLVAKVINLGNTFTYQAKAEGGSGEYRYAYYYKQADSETWIKKQDFTPNNTLELKPGAVKDYDLRVVVKDVKTGKTDTKDFKGTVKDRLVNQAVLSANTIVKGKSVTVTAAAKGGTGPYTYAVYYKKSIADQWMTKQDFSANNKVEITPLVACGYDVRVAVKDANGYVEEKTLKLTVRDKLANKSTISSDAILLGDSVTVNAKATGGSGSYTYAVSYKRATSNNWVDKQEFSENAAVKIVPQNATKYDILVKVKDSDGNVEEKSFTVEVANKLENTSVISSTKIVVGETVTVSASAKGGFGGYTYALYYKRANSSKWYSVQAYKANTAIKVKPAEATKYEVCVKVKDAKGNITKKFFKVDVMKALVNTSVISIGDDVTVLASAEGGIGDHTYCVAVKKTADSTWNFVQNFSSNKKVSVKIEKGVSYDICVKVKDAEGRIVKKYVTLTLGK